MTNEAINRQQEIKRGLEHDWSDKQTAMQIDHAMAKLAVNNSLAQFKVCFFSIMILRSG